MGLKSGNLKARYSSSALHIISIMHPAYTYSIMGAGAFLDLEKILLIPRYQPKDTAMHFQFTDSCPSPDFTYGGCPGNRHYSS